MTVKMLVFNVT